MFQQSEYDLTNVEVHFKELEDNSGYHVHVVRFNIDNEVKEREVLFLLNFTIQTPIESDLEFPCENSSLYGHWNPRKVDPKLSPPPGNGTSDQYELGDLSGKFGTLDSTEEYIKAYNDTNLPLYGYETVLGNNTKEHATSNIV